MFSIRATNPRVVTLYTWPSSRKRLLGVYSTSNYIGQGRDFDGYRASGSTRKWNSMFESSLRHSRSDVSKARIFVSFRCGLFVAFSGDLGRLVKPYFIEGYCYGNNFSLYRLINRFIRYVKLEYGRYCVMTFCYSIFCRDNRYQYCYFFFHSLCKI